MIEVRLEDKRVVAEVRGKPVGTFWFSVQNWRYHPRIFWVGFKDLLDADLIVATELYKAAVEAMKPQRPLLLYTGVEEDDPLRSVLLQLGFREFRRVYSPTLDVRAFDLSSLTKTTHTFEKLGYRIVILAELEHTNDTKKKLHALFNEVYADTSTVVPATPERFSLGAWWTDVIEDEDIIPEAFFIALRGDEMVGFGNLMHSYLVLEETELSTATFGTKRSHRHHHREIMMALKAREIAYAKAHGYATIRAEIDAENPWILQVCAELPFVQGKDYVSMLRVMNWKVTSNKIVTPGQI